jgi:DNA topoisomerase-1
MPYRIELAATLDPPGLAKLARLRYIEDQCTGFARRRNGHGFVYLNCRGAVLRDPRHIRRIESLVIPPAWQEVWICSIGNGHLQATGRDSRKRKQYLYHERWQYISNLAKFARMGQFGELLPKLRRTIAKQLAGKELTPERVLAGMVALLDLTGIRIGNEEYVKENGSYGLSTLRDRHVTVKPDGSVELRFRAKAGLRRTVVVEELELADLIQKCAALKGARLFQCVDCGEKVRPIQSADVNAYLQQITAQPYTAKDFRTWKASASAAGRLYGLRGEHSKMRRKRLVRETVCHVAEVLGNTPTVCRNYYIHPALLALFEDGSFDSYFETFKPRRQRRFSVEEQVLAHFLKSWKPELPPAA